MRNTMRVWLLHVAEQLPVDGATRVYRYGYLARALQEAGHDVLRWAPTYNHCTKQFRFLADCRVAIDRHYAVQFVHSPGYRRNAGLERLRTYRVLARRFREMATCEERPDLIVAAIPSLEWAEAAVDFGAAHGVPVVVDVRDIWPDVYLNALPRPARPLGRLALAPYYRMARRACQRAATLTAVSQSYLNWALRLAARAQQPHDMVAPLGFEPEPMSADALNVKLTQLRSLGIDPSRPTIMFAGLFEHSYDLETVVDAGRQLETSQWADVQFVLCGDGSKMPAVRRRSAGRRNIFLLGWVDGAMLQAVASIASIGLCPYVSVAHQSLPNKPFEYMAGRLAIVSSLPGELDDLLARHECGVSYAAGDAAALAKCLSGLLDAPDRMHRMRMNSYQAWLQNYRSRQIYTRLVDQLMRQTIPAPHAA